MLPTLLILSATLICSGRRRQTGDVRRRKRQLIMPRGVINYYRVMAQRYKLGHDRHRGSTACSASIGCSMFLGRVTAVFRCSTTEPPLDLGRRTAPISMRSLTGSRTALPRAKSLGRAIKPAEPLVHLPVRPARIRKRRSTSAAATSYKPPTGSAVVTWRRTFPLAPRFRGPPAYPCHVTTSLCSTSKRSTGRLTMRAAASTRPCVPDRPSLDENVSTQRRLIGRPYLSKKKLTAGVRSDAHACFALMTYRVGRGEDYRVNQTGNGCARPHGRVARVCPAANKATSPAGASGAERDCDRSASGRCS